MRHSIATCAISSPGAPCSVAMTVSTRIGQLCSRRAEEHVGAARVLLEVDPGHAD